MASIDLFQPYVYGTAFWYIARALCRLYDPVMVIGWFRPPSQANLMANDLEIYNVWTDGWGLLTLAAMLLVLTNTIPYLSSSSSSAVPRITSTDRPYARAAILISLFHHVTTAIGAYGHYAKESHYNPSMAIGVWVNVFLTLVGAAVLVLDKQEAGSVQVGKGHVKAI